MLFLNQSYLARLSLDLQLRRSGVFSHEDTISICGEEFDKFKICEFCVNLI